MEPLEMLRRKIEANRLAGVSLRGTALEIGCSAPYLSRVARGKKPISPVILEYLGVEKRVTYRRNSDAART